MKPRARVWLVTVAVAATSARAQGTFQNLDFEAARVVLLTNPPYNSWPYIATSNALPGWSAFSSVPGEFTNSLTAIALDMTNLTAPLTVSLLDANGGPIDGSFSVMLASPNSSIRQNGLVPAGVHWLFFKVESKFDSPVQVSLGGEKLSYVALGTEPNYTLYAADISAFAGRTATLTFTSSHWLSELDDIEFVVPEPSDGVLLLLGLGLLTYVWRRLYGGDKRSVGTTPATSRVLRSRS